MGLEGKMTRMSEVVPYCIEGFSFAEEVIVKVITAMTVCSTVCGTAVPPNACNNLHPLLSGPASQKPTH